MARETWRKPPKRCGARKRDGSPCPTWAMPNGRCRMHGGMSLGRPIVHGRRSSNPLVKACADVSGMTDEQKVDYWVTGPHAPITPCSRSNAMNVPGSSDSLPKMEPLPGAVVQQFRTVKGKRYGPYFFRVYSVGAGENRRQRKEYVPADQVELVRSACRRWKALDDLSESIKRAARDLKRSMREVQLGDSLADIKGRHG